MEETEKYSPPPFETLSSPSVNRDDRGSIGGGSSYPKFPGVFPKRDAGFEGQQNYLVCSRLDPWKNLAFGGPNDSERMSSRLGMAISEIATQFLCGD